MSPKKMLVVDDDQLLGWALEKGLPGENLSVRVVETGRDALLEIGKTNYHLILLDIHLPDVNGLELLGEIRKNSPDSRIIITSADVSESNKEKAFSGGARQFLEKPFSISTIQGLLRSTFGDYSGKRRHDRYICNLPFHVDFSGTSPEEAPHESGHHRGSILDVGKAGIRLSIDRPLAVGQKLRLAHALEDSTFTRFIPPGARAEVVWVAPNTDGCTAGLRFEGLNGFGG
jgi:DNA-binding response OmpR family regulator